MTPQFEYSIANQDDVRQFGNIVEQCFISLPGNIETYINRIGVENLRLIHRSEQVVGGLAMLSMGQWFGGQCVPMTGIAAVGIAPEHRGSGAAIALMQHTVKELHTKGVPISVLYPATQRLYRKAGYEQGGALCGWEIPTESIQIREQPLSVLPVPSDCQVFHDLYQQQARLINGHLDRNPAIWQQITQPDEKEIYYAYLLGAIDQPEGYIVFSQQPAEDGSLLLVKDRVVLTAAAAKTFWCFLANHRSQIKKVRWRGAASDSLMLLLPEQTAKLRFADRWLLRVIDVGKALSKRGYPSTIAAELHLEVRDDLVAENNGKFILSVSNGHGEVARGGKGDLKLDVRGLAPLYTGLFTPHQLQLVGQLDATETAISTATQIFAGLSPWMPDFF
jgi:predicted acetyltransferase